jgi:glycine hydroxymethyltransferase
MTTRGFGVAQSRQVANLIADLLAAPQDNGVLGTVCDQVAQLSRDFPVYR